MNETSVDCNGKKWHGGSINRFSQILDIESFGVVQTTLRLRKRAGNFGVREGTRTRHQ